LSGDSVAVEDILAGLAVSGETGFQTGAPNMLFRLAEAHIVGGQLADAHGAVELALAVAAETGQPHFDAELRRLQGDILLRMRDDPEEGVGDARMAEQCFQRALVLLPVLHPDTAAAWIARATEVTVRRLEDLVGWAVEHAEAGAPVEPPPAEGRLPAQPTVHTCARVDDGAITFDGPASVVGLLWAVIRASTPAAEPAWRGLERLLAHVTAQWTAQPRVRDPIFARDGWRCAVPACTARASLQDHHIVYRSRGGDNRRENRVAICAAHHLHGIHRMRVRVTGQAPDDLTWELGWRRGQPPLLRTHGDRYLDADAA
jgi:hypothetical protein